jgi:hypothetical protein
MSVLNWVAKGHIVHLSDDTLVDMEQRWNDIDSETPKILRETCSSASLSATNNTWPDLP